LWCVSFVAIVTMNSIFMLNLTCWLVIFGLLLVLYDRILYITVKYLCMFGNYLCINCLAGYVYVECILHLYICLCVIIRNLSLGSGFVLQWDSLCWIMLVWIIVCAVDSVISTFSSSRLFVWLFDIAIFCSCVLFLSLLLVVMWSI